MKTVRIKIYTFDELNEKAKQNAIENFRKYELDTDYIYDEAYETVKAFHNIFGTKENGRSWLDCDTSSIDDNILNLTGLRLRKYIINNYWNYLYKGKYFSLWSKKDITYQHHPKGMRVLKTRHSKVMFENCCTLTGVCYDNSILDPIYNFLEKFNELPDSNKNLSFEMLLNDCFAELEKDIKSEVENSQGDEYIIDEIQQKEYMYTADGNQFNN